jgi:hypothetical protein
MVVRYINYARMFITLCYYNNLVLPRGLNESQLNSIGIRITATFQEGLGQEISNEPTITKFYKLKLLNGV